MNLYRIRNWQDIYEVNRSRELKSVKWIPVPVNLSGDGYCQIMEQKNGPAIFGTFISLVELAAQCEPRGTLIRSSGEPHDFASIGRICRINSTLIEQTIIFTSLNLKWIEIIILNDNCDNTASMCDKGADAPVCIVGNVLSSSLVLSSLKPDGFEKQKFAKRSKIFTPPSFEEFEKYCQENGFKNIAARAFKGYSEGDWHDAQGNKIHSWKQKLQNGWFQDRNKDTVLINKPPDRPTHDDIQAALRREQEALS